jgi:hypothetical protein
MPWSWPLRWVSRCSRPRRGGRCVVPVTGSRTRTVRRVSRGRVPDRACGVLVVDRAVRHDGDEQARRLGQYAAIWFTLTLFGSIALLALRLTGGVGGSAIHSARRAAGDITWAGSRVKTRAADRRTRAEWEASLPERIAFFNSHRVFGVAGAGAAGTVGQFGATRATHGQVGEQVVGAELERQLAGRPLARLFHDVGVPGVDTGANVDHVWVEGDSVILVDSKSWLPGVYTRDVNGHAWRDGQPFEPADGMWLNTAVNAFQDALPNSIVFGVVIARPSRHGVLDFDQLTRIGHVGYHLLDDIAHHGMQALHRCAGSAAKAQRRECLRVG